MALPRLFSVVRVGRLQFACASPPESDGTPQVIATRSLPTVQSGASRIGRTAADSPCPGIRTGRFRGSETCGFIAVLKSLTDPSKKNLKREVGVQTQDERIQLTSRHLRLLGRAAAPVNPLALRLPFSGL